MRVLADIAYVRSGDKGNTCTAGLIAKQAGDYEALMRTVTPEAVRALYGEWVTGSVTIYPMENIQAVSVVMSGALGGGATSTLRLDQTGKSLGHGLLRLPVVEEKESS